MITRRNGGMTELIPSPSEKRDGAIRNHVLDLLANLDERIRRIEEAVRMSVGLAEEFAGVMERIVIEEEQVRRANEKVREATANISP
ncbi:MAG: VrlD [Armatimonadota bacterium]